MENKFWLSDNDFNLIYSKVPRLNIDLLIYKDKGLVLVKRSIEPYINHWHLPGGTVYKGETIKEASIRIAKVETGLDVEYLKCLDYAEFLNEERGDVDMHTISMIIEVISVGGIMSHDKNANDIKVVSNLNISPIVKQHLEFIQKHKIF